jgi:hypothetical protein
MIQIGKSTPHRAVVKQPAHGSQRQTIDRSKMAAEKQNPAEEPTPKGNRRQRKPLPTCRRPIYWKLIIDWKDTTMEKNKVKKPAASVSPSILFRRRTVVSLHPTPRCQAAGFFLNCGLSNQSPLLPRHQPSRRFRAACKMLLLSKQGWRSWGSFFCDSAIRTFSRRASAYRHEE